MSFIDLPDAEIINNLPPDNQYSVDSMTYLDGPFQFDMVEIANVYITIRKLIDSYIGACSRRDDSVKLHISKYLESFHDHLNKYLQYNPPISSSDDQSSEDPSISQNTSQDPSETYSRIVPILRHLQTHVTISLIDSLTGLGTSGHITTFEPSVIHTTDFCICLLIIFVGNVDLFNFRNTITSCPPMTQMISWLAYVLLDLTINTNDTLTMFTPYIVKYVYLLNISNLPNYPVPDDTYIPSTESMEWLESFMLPENATDYVTMSNTGLVLFQIHYSSSYTATKRDQIISFTTHWITSQNVPIVDFVNKYSTDPVVKTVQLSLGMIAIFLAQMSIVISKIQKAITYCKTDTSEDNYTNLLMNLRGLYKKIQSSEVFKGDHLQRYPQISEILTEYLADINPTVFQLTINLGATNDMNPSQNTIPTQSNMPLVGMADTTQITTTTPVNPFTVSGLFSDRTDNPSSTSNRYMGYLTQTPEPPKVNPSYGRRVNWDPTKIPEYFNTAAVKRSSIDRFTSYNTTDPKSKDYVTKVIGFKSRPEKERTSKALGFNADDVVITFDKPNLIHPLYTNLPTVSTNMPPTFVKTLVDTKTIDPQYASVMSKLSRMPGANSTSATNSPAKVIVNSGVSLATVIKQMILNLFTSAGISVGEVAWFILGGVIIIISISILVATLTIRPSSSSSTSTTSSKDATTDSSTGGVQSTQVFMQTIDQNQTINVTRDDLMGLLKDTHNLINLYSSTYDAQDTYSRPSYYAGVTADIIHTWGIRLIIMYSVVFVIFVVMICVKNSLGWIEKTKVIILSGIISNPYIIQFVVRLFIQIFTRTKKLLSI